VILFVDGLEQEAPDGTTVADLLERVGEAVEHALVELNGAYLHKTDYPATKLKAGDRLEIIYPAFGG
jgi:thiamine biosynthesis protein ThiS